MARKKNLDEIISAAEKKTGNSVKSQSTNTVQNSTKIIKDKSLKDSYNKVSNQNTKSSQVPITTNSVEIARNAPQAINTYIQHQKALQEREERRAANIVVRNKRCNLPILRLLICRQHTLLLVVSI